MIEYLKALKSIDISFSLSGIWDFINNMSFPVATVVIAGLVLFAVQGYKIFKSLVHVIAAVGFGFAGHLYLAPRVSGLVESRLPASISIDIDVVIALVCAIIGLLLAHFAYDFIVFCIGATTGYFVGYSYLAGVLERYFSNLTFLTSKVAHIVVGCVLALIVAIFFMIVFKQLYIIATSIGFMCLASLILAKTVMVGNSNSVLFGFIAIGAVIGVFMMVHQFDEEDKVNEFKF